MNAVQTLRKLLGLTPRISRERAMAAFTRRYASFKELLQANADLAGILAGLNAAQRGDRSLETRQVRKEARRAILQCERMAVCLNAISNQRHQALVSAVEALGGRIERELEQHTRGDVTSLTLPLSEVDASMAYSVGGKNANLGELRNMLDMPVPRGFAITIKAGTLFLLRSSGLFRNIYSQLRSVDAEKPSTISAASREIQRLIMEAPMPDMVSGPMLAAWDEAFGTQGDTVAALRSSAVAEDGVQSFAGQYRSILGVRRQDLLAAFKKVMASLFSERALTYRAAHGYALDATGMGLCCLEMVRAKAAGVAFSRHPVDLRSNCVLINGLWGLGEMVVDGSGTPDQWLVSRATRKIAQATIARKETRLQLTHTGTGVESTLVDVPEELREVPCLSDEQARRLAEMALELERHYQYPQDMEWAVDEDDQIILLQTRPMGLDSTPEESAAPVLKHMRPLLSGADVAARGVGCGPVVRVHPDEDLTHFPEGAVMLMQHSSPNAMTAMQRAAAIIAETGSLTGHMASICREFGVPTLMNLAGAASLLTPGRVVTVDALSGRVFDGEVPELLALRLARRRPRVDTPALVLLRRVAPYILPLHLVDPQSALFSPANCTSLHDVMRYAHELSYSEMFLLSDSLSESGAGGVASRLVCSVPLDLHIIDLGGGLKHPEASSTRPEDVTSVPFRHVLNGMLNPEVQAKGPRPVNMRGFLSVMSQTMIGGNQQGGQRFGDRSYAIVSDRYLNFSSRVGYHYAILDTWCGDTLSKNYIRFEFAGGAAGSEQRARRVRCIGLILRELGFTVEVTGDRVRARYQKYPRLELCSRLDQLGRLLIMTRQMDMLMVNDEAVQAYAAKFLNGEYH
ncbi:PEP/pyruvate-binding domain-containing protein [uncultured Desulfovibrio sp.]|uniref:PEP/pyruvate-binding domain-containing protein n=2 Tax=uncultured Desulfovibrio sp. TaxID=167968 RepID=UPI00260EEE26|nr:PEP/pyruvate-binding domain-containing protein [uncultured Desulfovibrio sp.]